MPGQEGPAPALDVVIESIADQVHADGLSGIRPDTAATNNQDSTRTSEVPVDNGVRVHLISADTNTPGAQSVPWPDRRVRHIASWLRTANERALAGEAINPLADQEVLGHFKSAPTDQTRIQILAATARTLSKANNPPTRSIRTNCSSRRGHV